jgi:hypothetical protein
MSGLSRSFCSINILQCVVLFPLFLWQTFRVVRTTRPRLHPAKADWSESSLPRKMMIVFEVFDGTTQILPSTLIAILSSKMLSFGTDQRPKGGYYVSKVWLPYCRCALYYC